MDGKGESVSRDGRVGACGRGGLGLGLGLVGWGLSVCLSGGGRQAGRQPAGWGAVGGGVGM